MTHDLITSHRPILKNVIQQAVQKGKHHKRRTQENNRHPNEENKKRPLPTLHRKWPKMAGANDAI